MNLSPPHLHSHSSFDLPYTRPQICISLHPSLLSPLLFLSALSVQIFIFVYLPTGGVGVGAGGCGAEVPAAVVADASADVDAGGVVVVVVVAVGFAAAVAVDGCGCGGSWPLMRPINNDTYATMRRCTSSGAELGLRITSNNASLAKVISLAS